MSDHAKGPLTPGVAEADPPWLLLETLQTGLPTVVSSGGRSRPRSSLARALKTRMGGKSASLLWNDILRATERARVEASAVEAIVELANRSTRISAHPVIGIDGIVHGVHLWIADSHLPSPSQPPDTSLAMIFEPEARAVVVRADLTDVFDTDRTSFTLPELFRHVYIDDALAVITRLLAVTRSPGDTWDGLMTARIGGENMRLHAVLTATENLQWRGLVHIVHDDAVPPPTLETAALTALGTVTPHTALALMDITHTRLIRWLTDPVPGIQWKGIVDNRDTPHPADVERIFAAARKIYTGETTRVAVSNIRLRRAVGGWTIVDAVCSILPSTDEKKNETRLALVHFTIKGRSEDPDPVPVHDQGHPSLLSDPAAGK